MEENPWKTLHRRKIYDNPWIEVEEHQVTNPAGNPGIYGKVHFKNRAIAILPLDEADHTWLVGQYRYVLGRYSWEIPEGGGPLQEDPLVAAKRELKEETGLAAGRWTEVLRMDISNSVTDETAVGYLAQDLTCGTPEPEETEQLALRRLPFSEALEMVMAGEIQDALSIAMILKIEQSRKITKKS